MSTVFLHVGQAGNEIGAAYWSLAGSEKPPKRWLFDECERARCVLVDTEPKVVRGVVRTLGADKIHPRCALVEQGGRGNNWAMGYHGVNARNGIAEAALEALRWQWERCDWCGGLVLCHSVGGGTGSGLGSLLMQEVRDAYPRHYLTAAALCPFGAGELPLGHYNATLALSYLQEFADATLLFDNTQLLRQLASAAATQSHSAAHSARPPARVCMRQLDAYVARGLAGLTFPTDGVSGRRPFDPADLVSTVCPIPSLKCLTLYATPTHLAETVGSSLDSSCAMGGGTRGSQPSGGAVRPAPWDTLVGELVSRANRYDLHDRPALTLSSQVTARGVANEPPDARSQSRLAQLLGGSPCTPFPIDWKLSTSAATALPANGESRLLTLASNRTTVGPQLEQVLVRAKLQLLGKAYVHHYENYGVEADFIRERAELLQQVVDEYEVVRGALGSRQS